MPTFPSNFNSAIHFTSKQVAPQAQSGEGRRSQGDSMLVIVQCCEKRGEKPTVLEVVVKVCVKRSATRWPVRWYDLLIWT